MVQFKDLNCMSRGCSSLSSACQRKRDIEILTVYICRYIYIFDVCMYNLEIDPQRDDDSSPMSSYRCMLRPTCMLISALQHKSNWISNFWKKYQILGFPWCSTREDLSIDVSITNVGLILTKLRWFLFSGYGQTDRVLESSHGNMSAHKKFQLKTQN